MNPAALSRYFIGFISATVVTFALLWVMQYLIESGEKALTSKLDLKFVDFVRVKRDETLNTDPDKPKEPPKPETPPDTPPPQSMDDVDTSSAVSMSAVGGRIGADIGIGGFQIVDGDYLPIVKVAPIYPRRALSRGVEGNCLVGFTVTELGTVRDPYVVECTSGLFERASMNAVLKFKYKPRVVDGNPVEVPNVQHVITYKLED